LSAVLLYLLTVVPFSRDFPDGANLERYYYSRRKWFFGLLIAVYIIDSADTLAKGWDYALNLGLEYWAIGIAAHICTDTSSK